MRSWVVLAALVASVASPSWFSQVDAAACATICYTTELTGFGPGGTAGCSCTGSGATRTGSGSCSCGQCYTETNGAVIGYAINSDGTCTYGTDCGDCTYSSDSSSSKSTTSSSSSSKSTTGSTSSNSTTTTTTTAAPATTSPAATSGTASSNSTSGTSSSSSSTADTTNNSSTTKTTSSNSGSSDNNAGDTAGSSTASTSSDNGLKTWQIALIICCGVLVFTVAVVSVLSCYCKARNRLYENEDDQADASYYQQQYPRARQDVVGSGSATPTLFSQMPSTTRSHARSGSSGSLSGLSSELKPMYANPANSGSADRLGVGLAPVHMRNSSGDLAGMAGSYPNERILSGSYPADRRASSSNRSAGRRPSLEQGYNSARDRDSLAVEL